jgi:hypothetical protein
MRRGALAVVGAAVAALLAGCSVHPGTAALVDGRAISQQYLDDTYDEIGNAGLDKATILVFLIVAPSFIEAAAEQGVGVSVSDARAAAEAGLAGRGVSEVSDGTVEFFRLTLAVQNLQNVPGGADLVNEVAAEALSAEMDINPRYGDLDPVTAKIARPPLPWIVGG